MKKPLIFAQLAAEKCFLLRSYWVAEFVHKNASNLQRLEHHHEEVNHFNGTLTTFVSKEMGLLLP